ncbi:HVA22-like protein i [Citrus sinensis]|nr:HVA22-like protein i [Citrus sinensis]
MGYFLSRPLLMVFGYAYPAYECFKAVEKNKPDIEQLLFWCQYWLPMYREAKLAFFIYLWYPQTKKEIDLNLLKLRIKAREIGLLLWEKAAIYGQTRKQVKLFFILLLQQQEATEEAGHLPTKYEAAAKMETVPESSSFQDGNLINSFNQKGVSSDQAIPQSRSKWRLLRTAASQ